MRKKETKCLDFQRKTKKNIRQTINLILRWNETNHRRMQSQQRQISNPLPTIHIQSPKLSRQRHNINRKNPKRQVINSNKHYPHRF